MEYAEGGELFYYIVKKKRLTENEVNYFFYQIVNALDYIHKNKVAHRDLKPENILLNNHKDKILKVIDFGLSNDIFEGYQLTTPCGSPCYAAPEMILGKKYSGVKVDIWSIGIILFAMTSGYLPFEDKTNDNLFKKIVECKVEYPNFIPFVHKDLIKKILVLNPKDRVNLEDIKKHYVYLNGMKIYLKNTFNKQNEISSPETSPVNKRKNERRENIFSIPSGSIKESPFLLSNKKPSKISPAPKIRDGSNSINKYDNLKKKEKEIIIILLLMF